MELKLRDIIVKIAGFCRGRELAVMGFGRGREFHKSIAKLELFRTKDLSLF
jgi:hypothetical protein